MKLMENYDPVRWGNAAIIVLSGTCAAFLAWYLYRGMLDPRDAVWLLREGDSFQHFIGWHFFRQEPWGWPLGAVNQLATELSTSLVFTDSVPLYAIPLKLLHPWLPETFQYLGLVVFINYCLNGAVACRLLLRLRVPAYVALVGAVLISSLPIVVSRGLGIHGHEALTAHWLILLAIELTLFSKRPSLKASLCWLLLLIIAVMMHFYLFFMVGVFWAAWWVYLSSGIVIAQVFNSRRSLTSRIRYGLTRYTTWWITGVATPLIVLFVMWAVGYFHLGEQSAASGGYGYYSAELLTFFNPQSSAWYFDENFTSMSALFPGWQPLTEGQYEGMAYVGAGVLLLWLALAVVATFLPSRRHTQPSTLPANDYRQSEHHHSEHSASYQWWPAWAASLGLFAFAIAGTISFGSGGIPLHYDVLFIPFRDYVRSSGRMVWPLLYLLLAITFMQLSWRLKARWLAPLLLLAIVIQREDLRDWYGFIRETVKGRVEISRAEPLAYDVLKDNSLDSVWRSHDSLIAFPAHDLNALKPYLWLAAKYDLSINVAYLARANHQIIDAATQRYREHLQQGQLPEGHIYLVTDPLLSRQACRLRQWECAEHEGVTTVWQQGVSTSIETP